MAISTETKSLRAVLLPGMDGTGELFSEFVAALPVGLESVTVRYPTDRCLSYSELEELVRAASSQSHLSLWPNPFRRR